MKEYKLLIIFIAVSAALHAAVVWFPWPGGVSASVGASAPLQLSSSRQSSGYTNRPVNLKTQMKQGSGR